MKKIIRRSVSFDSISVNSGWLNGNAVMRQTLWTSYIGHEIKRWLHATHFFWNEWKSCHCQYVPDRLPCHLKVKRIDILDNCKKNSTFANRLFRCVNSRRRVLIVFGIIARS
jgi:hypothetical protein